MLLTISFKLVEIFDCIKLLLIFLLITSVMNCESNFILRNYVLIYDKGNSCLAFVDNLLFDFMYVNCSDKTYLQKFTGQRSLWGLLYQLCTNSQWLGDLPCCIPPCHFYWKNQNSACIGHHHKVLCRFQNNIALIL